VIKKDGRREPFDREKIVRGLRHAFTKRPVPIETLLRLAEDVEREASESGEKEIAAKVVGEKLLPKIRALDPVAYVRFASIYREFRDVDEFMSELASLVKHRAGSAGPGGTGPGGTGPGGKASA
jgi:transcriptional repressor NrdR